MNHGALEIVDLSRIPHSQTAIPDEPDPGARLEFDAQRSFAITDVKYFDGEIFVTGVSNRRFASTLHRIAYPFDARTATCTVEIRHPVHGEWETRAPIIRQLVKEVQGEPYLFAAYGCTPLVRFPLASLTDGAHVRGDLIGQLGYGSTPRTCSPSPTRSTRESISWSPSTCEAPRRSLFWTSGRPSLGRPAAGSISRPAVWARRRCSSRSSPTTSRFSTGMGGRDHRHRKTGYRLDVSSLAVPYFFERKDGMSEMNWPDGPDPFHYHEHRGEISRGS